MQVTHSYKEHIFHLFPPHLKTNSWMIWHHHPHPHLDKPKDTTATRITGSLSATTLQWHHNERDGVSNKIICVLIVYSTVWSGPDQRKHQSSASLAFVRGIHRWPVNSLNEGPVTRNIFPFHDVILKIGNIDIGGECSSMKCEESAPPYRCVLMNKINSHPK